MKEGNLHLVSSVRPPVFLIPSLFVITMACSFPGAAVPPPGSDATATGKSPTDRGSAPTPLLAGPVVIGEPFLICDTAVTVIGWDNVPTGEFFTPGAGNRFVSVEIVLVNLGPEAVETSWYSFTLLDAHADAFPEGVFPVTLAKGTILSGGLAVGERTRAKIGYEVPEEEQEFSLKAGCWDYYYDLRMRSPSTWGPLRVRPKPRDCSRARWLTIHCRPGRARGSTRWRSL